MRRRVPPRVHAWALVGEVGRNQVRRRRRQSTACVNRGCRQRPPAWRIPASDWNTGTCMIRRHRPLRGSVHRWGGRSRAPQLVVEARVEEKGIAAPQRSAVLRRILFRGKLLLLHEKVLGLAVVHWKGSELGRTYLKADIRSLWRIPHRGEDSHSALIHRIRPCIMSYSLPGLPSQPVLQAKVIFDTFGHLAAKGFSKYKGLSRIDTSLVSQRRY